MTTLATEKHYRAKDLASLWRVTANTIRRLFADELGVIRISTQGKRATLSIPESVVLRVHERLSNQRLQVVCAPMRPLRVISLRDLRARKYVKSEETSESANPQL
jgi:hypothetical protein